MYLNQLELRKIIEKFLFEDIGSGDITTNSIVQAGAVSHGYIISREMAL
ncbi:MAG: nicotinate-nucleotide pyrophosphorylase [Firmicutes bacterium ADurb.Bin373]|nr:MAG: nicotinate-nucleotide pyrophosphorylase [Firmicutes bacterium ADurb.Bin373]